MNGEAGIWAWEHVSNGTAAAARQPAKTFESVRLSKIVEVSQELTAVLLQFCTRCATTPRRLVGRTLVTSQEWRYVLRSSTRSAARDIVVFRDDSRKTAALPARAESRL